MTKQAILIMAHNNLDLLNKLIELLDSDYFDIFLHIDKKSDIMRLIFISVKSLIYLFIKSLMFYGLITLW